MKPRWEFEVEQILRERAEREAASGAGRVSLPGLVEAVGKACRVDRSEMMSSSRHRDIVEARELLAHTAHEWAGASYPEISRAIGRRHHTTMLSAATRFQKRPEPQRTEALDRVRTALPRGVEVPSRHGRGS